MRDGLFAFLVALALYSYTLSPDLQWGDSAKLALQVRESQLELGTAGSHPLYVLVGMAFAALPGDLPRNLNLLSAVCAALAVAVTLRIAGKLAGARQAGWFAAAALAVAHAFWFHAVITEVYTLNALFVALLLWLLLEWRDHGQGAGRLALVALVFLVGLTNHLVLAGLLPAIAVFLVATKPPGLLKWSAWLLTLVSLGGALAWWLVPGTGPALSRVLYGPPPITHYFSVSRDLSGLGRETLFYLLYLCYQFPLGGLLIGAWGLVRLARRDPSAALLLAVGIAVNAAVFINNTDWPSLGSAKYVFYVQDYLIFAILLGYGTWDLMQRWSGRQGPRFPTVLAAALFLMPIVVYTLVPITLERLGIDVVKARRLPYRESLAYFLNPSKRMETSARQFGEAAFDTAEPGAVIIADYTPRMVLRYLQRAEGERPDVLLVPSQGPWGPVDIGPVMVEQASRPIYLAQREARYYNLDAFRAEFDFVPTGPLFKLCARTRLSAPPK